MEITQHRQVTKFLSSLDELILNQILDLIDALVTHGHLLAMPYSKPLGGGLFELRYVGKIQVRIVYCFHSNKAHLLHALSKKSQKIPHNVIVLARQRKRFIESL